MILLGFGFNYMYTVHYIIFSYSKICILIIYIQGLISNGRELVFFMPL